MQSNTPATTTESTSIFLLNPLTVYFLSGFALQLFIFSCDHDHVASDKRSAKTTYESHIRMTRWLGVFKKHCAELFDLHSELYEKKAVEKSNSSHQLHSKLLIGATCLTQLPMGMSRMKLPCPRSSHGLNLSIQSKPQLCGKYLRENNI